MYTKHSNLKTLINVNTKFRTAKKSHFSHYCNISDQPVGSLEIFNSQSFFSRLILLVSNKLGTKKSVLAGRSIWKKTVVFCDVFQCKI